MQVNYYIHLLTRSIAICKYLLCLDSEIRCARPKDPPNGVYTVSRLTREGRLSLRCNRGFASTHDDEVTCSELGYWSQPLPTCRSK